MSDVEAPGTATAADVSRVFNPYLHGARGLFALMIVLYHVVNSRLPTFGILAQGPGWFLGRTLEHGVELFFGVSGIVIVGALRRATNPWTFAIDRATRIYPVLWVCVLVLVLMETATHFRGSPLPNALVFVANLLALPPLVSIPLLHPAAWSLSYEMAFYLFCTLAWLGWSRFGRRILLVMAPFALFLMLTHIRATLMPVGMLAAWWALRSKVAKRLAAAPGFMFLCFLCGWETLCRAGGGDLINASPAMLLRPLSVVEFGTSIIAALLFFVGVMQGRGWTSRVLASPVFQFLGTISYSLYLWHPLVMSVVKTMMFRFALPEHVGEASQLVFFALALPPSLTVAWLSSITLEQQVTPWLRQRVLKRSTASVPRLSSAQRAPYPESPA